MFQKLYNHLEEINRNTQNSKNTLLHAEEWAGKMSEQLETINSSILSRKRSRTSLRLLTATLFIAGLGTIMIVLLVWHSFQFSHSLRVSLDRNEEASHAASVAFTSYQALAQKQMDMQAEAVRMDSLVEQQSQMIKELRQLNKVAVRALIHLKKTVDQQKVDGQAAMPLN
ncbi:hypothetical protein Q4E93_04230 [Flavitalea sp. BT771]|uniref:hypothetical protein n=1 Tax=Flavitalea sp. BT771 TaxID=3063329 RepID=UPI0026E18B87|nr:hypothetical protein [Flavitalea sp. BT771]MDO6429776.1 hypothetical protein [Flavitalea sp. BT771]MDV6218096.1 hypothetical protein [Flavitalea sp. BT771]